MKSFVFDIDGTLCTKTDGDYTKAKPYERRIKTINRLYDEGNTIILLTARGMGRHKNDSKKAEAEFYDLTVKQLSQWGVKYHRLFMGKPSGDIYIDDKGCNDQEWFNDNPRVEETDGSN